MDYSDIVFYIYDDSDIFIYIYIYKLYVVHFTYFCEKEKGGGGAVNFGSLFSFVPDFLCFQ